MFINNENRESVVKEINDFLKPFINEFNEKIISKNKVYYEIFKKKNNNMTYINIYFRVENSTRINMIVITVSKRLHFIINNYQILNNYDMSVNLEYLKDILTNKFTNIYTIFHNKILVQIPDERYDIFSFNATKFMYENINHVNIKVYYDKLIEPLQIENSYIFHAKNFDII